MSSGFLKHGYDEWILKAWLCPVDFKNMVMSSGF